MLRALAFAICASVYMLCMWLGDLLTASQVLSQLPLTENKAAPKVKEGGYQA